MTIERARQLSEELKGRYDSPYNSEDKQLIRLLYREVLGKEMRQTNCQSCFHDAVIEIYLHLKKNNDMAKPKKYTLRAGFIISCPTFKGGKIYTNDNLTDEVAEKYIEQFPQQKRFFVIDNTVDKEKEQVKETSDKAAKKTKKK